jgi:hypothetical protein
MYTDICTHLIVYILKQGIDVAELPLIEKCLPNLSL